jgi:hypothetical protein
MIKSLENIENSKVEQVLLLIEQTNDQLFLETLQHSTSLSNEDVDEMISLLTYRLAEPNYYLFKLPDSFKLKYYNLNKTNPVFYKPEKNTKSKQIFAIETKSSHRAPHLPVESCLERDSLELDMVRASHGYQPNHFQRAMTIYQRRLVLGLKFCSSWLTNYRPYVLQEIKKDGFNAVYMHPRFTEDLEIMKFAVLSKPWIIRIFPKAMWHHLNVDETFLIENKELFPEFYASFLDKTNIIEEILTDHPHYVIYTRNHHQSTYFLVYSFLKTVHIYSHLNKKEQSFLQDGAIAWLKNQSKETHQKLKRINQISYFCQQAPLETHRLLLRFYSYFHKKVPHEYLKEIGTFDLVIEDILVLNWNEKETIEWFKDVVCNLDSSILDRILTRINNPPREIVIFLLENNNAIPNEGKLKLFGLID